MLLDHAVVRRLYRDAEAARWHVSEAQFGAALAESVKRGAAGLTGGALDRYLKGLHLQDLALACACADGDESAWDYFVLTYRPVLYRTADAIDASGGARELADSLYGELFGLREREGVRQSHFRYFHGRSSLPTWLRAVLAQRHVDQHRSVRRLDPLPDDESPSAFATPVPTLEPERGRCLQLIEAAFTSAMASLDPRERLRLACYYAQDLTLAQTGRLLGEHEATTSRQLARTRAGVRADVERRLRDTHGLDDAEIAHCVESVAKDAGPLDLRQLLAGEGDRKKSALDRSTEEDIRQ